jgi:hypothetical protein
MRPDPARYPVVARTEVEREAKVIINAAGTIWPVCKDSSILRDKGGGWPSREVRPSKWVRFEVDWLLRNRGADRMVRLLLDRTHPSKLVDALVSVPTVDVRFVSGGRIYQRRRPP